jgi:hypothetical protein
MQYFYKKKKVKNVSANQSLEAREGGHIKFRIIPNRNNTSSELLEKHFWKVW